MYLKSYLPGQAPFLLLAGRLKHYGVRSESMSAQLGFFFSFWFCDFIFLYLFYFIESIGVTLVNKIIWVSGIQFYNT